MHDWSNTAEVFSRILHGMLASFLIHEYKQTCKKQLFVISHNLNVRSKEVSIVSLPQDILKRDFKRHMLKRSEKQYATGAAMALRRR